MSPGIPRPLKILIIDDDKVFSRALEARLAKTGFRIETAFDGPSGLQLLSEKKFDVVILDLVMIGMPGFEVLPEIRKNDPNIPVIILSLLHQEEDVERVMKLGANKFFAKSAPSFLEELVKYLEEVSVS